MFQLEETTLNFDLYLVICGETCPGEDVSFCNSQYVCWREQSSLVKEVPWSWRRWAAPCLWLRSCPNHLREWAPNISYPPYSGISSLIC